MDLLYDAYDSYKEVVRKAHGNDAELEAIGLSHLGRLQYKVFIDIEKASKYYNMSLRGAFGL